MSRKLQTLDLQGVKLITLEGIRLLIGEFSAFKSTIKHINVSFLPLLPDDAILMMIKHFPSLERLEFRGGMPIRDFIITSAKDRVKLAILSHSEQLKLKDDVCDLMTFVSPQISSICPEYRWPYVCKKDMD